MHIFFKLISDASLKYFLDLESSVTKKENMLLKINHLMSSFYKW
jgi:hypothetical protein